ncbi:NADPH-dependent 2,4-dienoyl-CoA reductase [Corynebacterium sp.]|uniref:NADPH-dependent 2,4-dienoyl-CoA reductase n=1 Tax=Corynebacterium sp. TaxID=1720 RepID=UPI0026DBEA9C|nr:NADPH-dependent 2,4-dienoyl-CoA reductase [Corynebacterium sp.]MDO4609631.1 NADPH-dependent 2,4-dienoyl-CoA reductase [Corynebacterium sp.]
MPQPSPSGGGAVRPDCAASPYPHLTSPIDVGPFQLRNRVVMGSMHTGLEERVADVPKLAAYLGRRARGGAGLIVTGGYAPNVTGWLLPAGSMMRSRRMADAHRAVTDEVHAHGGRVVMQLLHSGRYGYHPFIRTASASQSPITPFRAFGMTGWDVRRTVDAYARAAELAKRAGYDGVEIMGSEGYLLNQFLAERVNHRSDHWGGSADKRMNLPVEVARRIRDAGGDDFLVQYRISLADLVEGGQSWSETVELAHRLEAVGVDVFNTGIGWHEARVPTIVTSVPRAAFAEYTAALRREVSIPVTASNRINDAQVAEDILAAGQADLVSMARPMLADPDFAAKAAAGRADEINVCIACNQACLDRTFANKKVSCLVNPIAGREIELQPLRDSRAVAPKRVAVIGAGVAGLAFAEAAATRGHHVEVFEASGELGGQFRLAARVPGKEEYGRSLDYFARRLEVLGVPVHLNERADAAELLDRGFDRVAVTSGVRPRIPDIEGADHPCVVTYDELLSGAREAGRRVAVIGAGGIGVDVAEFLTREPDQDVATWREAWGVASPEEFAAGARAALGEPTPHRDLPGAIDREVHLLQRRTGRMGRGPGKTTGWVHAAELKKAGVVMHPGVTYRRIDDEGLHVTEPAADGEGTVDRVIPVDTVVICAGQESEVAPGARSADGRVRDDVLILGGADVAAELDAERAIRQAVTAALRL